MENSSNSSLSTSSLSIVIIFSIIGIFLIVLALRNYFVNGNICSFRSNSTSNREKEFHSIRSGSGNNSEMTKIENLNNNGNTRDRSATGSIIENPVHTFRMKNPHISQPDFENNL